MNLTNSYQFIKVFPTKLFCINVFLMKPTINLLKFCSSKFHVGLIFQTFSPTKLLCYTVVAPFTGTIAFSIISLEPTLAIKINT